MRFKTGISIMRDQGGYVLVISMLVLVLLTLTAVFAAHQSSTEMRIAANNKENVQAFYMAQAGLQHAKVWLVSNGETAPYTSGWSSSFNSPGNLHYTVAVHHKTEVDYGEDLNKNGSFADIILWGGANASGTPIQNTSIGAPIEIVTSTGTTGAGKVKLTAEFTRDFIEMKYAAFGDTQVNVNNSGNVMKGSRSSGKITTAPYLASVASNQEVELKNKSNIYGNVELGKNTSGSSGKLTDHDANIYGTAPNYVDRIDPDPLGVNKSGSQLNNDFKTYSTKNDNAKAVTTEQTKSGTVTTTGLSGSSISLDKGQTMTLTAGNYYATSIDLKEDCTLNIDVSAGPVNIYLTGSLESKTKSDINLLPGTSNADKFTIFSNSSQSIDIKNSASFTGLIYAPNADITIYNSGDYYGMAWGKTVDIKNSGELVYDPQLKNKFLASSYSLFSWKEHRD